MFQNTRIAVATTMMLVISGLGSSANGARRSERFFTICETLSKAKRLDGTMIAVRGVYRSSREGQWLTSLSRCPVPLPEKTPNSAIALSMADADTTTYNKYPLG
jgi:hypothetical protein